MDGLVLPRGQVPDQAAVRLNKLARRILTEPRTIEILFNNGDNETFDNVDFVEAQGNFLLLLIDKDNKVLRFPISTIKMVTETLKPGQ